MGWNSMEETRILVDVCENITLNCEFIINNQSVHTSVQEAKPGIPIVYVFYNIPSKSRCRLIWNDEVEIEFLVNSRLRIPSGRDDSFPLVEYVRFDLHEYISVPKMVYDSPNNEKVVLLTGNCNSGNGGVEGWSNILKTRPTLVIHNGFHIDCRDLLRMHNKGILPIRNLWRKIREKYAIAWKENEVKWVMAVNSNILTNDSKPYPNYYLVRLNSELLKQLVISSCGDISSYVNINMSLNFEETLFIINLIYQEILWRDIPFEYDGSYKNFMVGNKHYFVLDSKFYRNELTFFGNTQLTMFETALKYINPGANIIIVVPSNPFKITSFKRATPKVREKWGYSKIWIADFIHLINAAQKYRITFIGSGQRQFYQELYYKYSGSILRSYVLPSIRYTRVPKITPKIRKRLSEYSLIYSNIQEKYGYLVIENELCTFITNS